MLFLLSALAAYLLLSLISYNPQDPGWSFQGPSRSIQNYGGVVGAEFADIFLSFFGYLAYLLPVMVAYSGWLVFRGYTPSGGIDFNILTIRWAGFLITVASGCGLAALYFPVEMGTLPLAVSDAGGVLGGIVRDSLQSLFSFMGATLFLLAAFLTGVTLFTGLSWLHAMDTTGRLTFSMLA